MKRGSVIVCSGEYHLALGARSDLSEMGFDVGTVDLFKSQHVEQNRDSFIGHTSREEGMAEASSRVCMPTRFGSSLKTGCKRLARLE